jgi:hypothetical protein
MLKEFSVLLKIYTGTLIVPPSFDTVHHFLSQITNFVVTLCSTKVYTGPEIRVNRIRDNESHM